MRGITRAHRLVRPASGHDARRHHRQRAGHLQAALPDAAHAVAGHQGRRGKPAHRLLAVAEQQLLGLHRQAAAAKAGRRTGRGAVVEFDAVGSDRGVRRLSVGGGATTQQRCVQRQAGELGRAQQGRADQIDSVIAAQHQRIQCPKGGEVAVREHQPGQGASRLGGVAQVELRRRQAERAAHAATASGAQLALRFGRAGGVDQQSTVGTQHSTRGDAHITGRAGRRAPIDTRRRATAETDQRARRLARDDRGRAAGGRAAGSQHTASEHIDAVGGCQHQIGQRHGASTAVGDQHLAGTGLDGDAAVGIAALAAQQHAGVQAGQRRAFDLQEAGRHRSVTDVIDHRDALAADVHFGDATTDLRRRASRCGIKVAAQCQCGGVGARQPTGIPGRVRCGEPAERRGAGEEVGTIQVVV